MHTPLPTTSSTRCPASAKAGIAWTLALALAAGGAIGCSESDAQDAVLSRAPADAIMPLPNKDGSFKFGVLGDFGTGDRDQFEMGAQMARLHSRFKFGTVILTGDNLYGSERPQDFRNKFELPYKALLDAGVKFHASLGNHDQREQRYYKRFNMGGQLYYTFNPGADVRFFALESSYMEPEQLAWVQKELKGSTSDWKIAFFHHPLYSSGGRHGSDLRLRKVLEPMFVDNNVSVVFTGHDHFYERVKPQNGITYFVIGAGGKLRDGDIDSRSGLTDKGFDSDLTFFAAEIDGDQMFFNVISRTGEIVDSGVIRRRIVQTAPDASTPAVR